MTDKLKVKVEVNPFISWIDDDKAEIRWYGVVTIGINGVLQQRIDLSSYSKQFTTKEDAVDCAEGIAEKYFRIHSELLASKSYERTFEKEVE